VKNIADFDAEGEWGKREREKVREHENRGGKRTNRV
jgi:hypothetical protein